MCMQVRIKKDSFKLGTNGLQPTDCLTHPHVFHAAQGYIAHRAPCPSFVVAVHSGSVVKHQGNNILTTSKNALSDGFHNYGGGEGGCCCGCGGSSCGRGLSSCDGPLVERRSKQKLNIGNLRLARV